MNNSNLNNKISSKVEETSKVATTEAEVKETATVETKNEENSQEVKKEETSTTDTEKKETTPAVTTTPPALPAVSTAIPTTPTEVKKEEPKPLVLNYLDADFIFDVLSVPSVSGAEYRMITFIMMWARENNVHYEFDTYGNIYLTKGELEEGEFYPCVTSHLDTVQSQQKAYAQFGMPLKLEERINAKGGHELFVKGMGIGADDKAGILISLSLFKYADKLKACFFLEEEKGCCGSKHLNKKWFENVGYVIGWDSPERNRAAYACSGELLFSKAFFEEIEETCKEHGVTVFNSEPFTDVREIRSQTEVMCMNFGNGGYEAHRSTEYVIMEDIDGACGLGVALIKKLGMRKFRMESKNNWGKSTNYNDEDVKYFCGKDSYSRNYGGYNTGFTYNSNTQPTTTVHTPTKPTQIKDDNKLDAKVLDYTVERYEQFIDNIQKKVEKREEAVLKAIKELCEKNGVEYADFLQPFLDNPSTEPFSTAIEF